jgi:large subunit ribosomal protein L1
MDIKQALTELRKLEKKNFDQSIDLVINLKGIDVKRDNIATVVSIPHKFKDKKVCGFLTKKSELVRTITQPDFVKYRDKKPLKELVKEYDFFIAAAPLMPAVATAFGKALGPTGKMPSPQLGVVMKEDDSAIKQLLEKIEKSIKIRVKEPSVKVSIGKESMSDAEIIANAEAVYHGLIGVLPVKKDNVKNIMLKLTMSAPVKVEIK